MKTDFTSRNKPVPDIRMIVVTATAFAETARTSQISTFATFGLAETFIETFSSTEVNKLV